MDKLAARDLTCTDPCFSIVTITLNNRNGLRRTALSIELQDCSDFEWIVVDGGSNDGTVDDLATYPKISSWISEPDNGISDAWNKGIRKAKGRYLVLLNSGDTIDPHCLSIMQKHVSDDRITCCHAKLSTESGDLVGVFKARPQHLWRGMHLPHNWAFVPLHFHRDQELGLYKPLRHSMDFDWFHRYYRRFGRKGFRIVDQVLGTYYLGGHSDAAFVNSFRWNKRIQRENGMSNLLSTILCCGYIGKHWIVHRMIPKLKQSR